MKGIDNLLSSSLLGLVLFGCGGADESAPPIFHLAIGAPEDSSCIGVSGFEIELTVGNNPPITVKTMRVLPVLDRMDCKLSVGETFPDIPTDIPIGVKISGYDGARQLRVEGRVEASRLEELGSVVFVLEPAGQHDLPVLAINRASILGGRQVGEVANLELSRGSERFEWARSETNEAYFLVGEPRAIGFPIPLSVGDSLNVKVSFESGNPVSSKMEIGQEESGTFYNVDKNLVRAERN